MEGSTDQHRESQDKEYLLPITGERTEQESRVEPSYGTCEEKETSKETTVTKIYKTRFWVLGIFSVLCFENDVQWITWGPISETMSTAFPGWGTSTVALLTNWGNIMYVLCVLPTCWATQRYSLRAGMVAATTLLTVGTALRCFTTTTPAFTVLCHMCAILVGMATSFTLTVMPLIAAAWFPVKERTTALAVMLGAHQLGGMGSYLEPLLVQPPSPDTSITQLQHDVMFLMYLDAAMAGVLLVAVLAYFPSKPPSPPSITSASERIEFRPSLRALAKNKKLLVLLVPYAVFIGPPVVWITVLDYSLLPLGFEQDDAMWVGLLAVVASSVAPVISGRIYDLVLQGRIKFLLFLLMFITTVCFYWFLLLTYGVIPLSTWQIYVSVVGGIACNYATLPLFSEAAFDVAYPVPEVLVIGLLIAADTFISMLFLLVFNIQNVGYHWKTYTLTITSSFTVLPLIGYKFDNTRADIDK